MSSRAIVSINEEISICKFPVAISSTYDDPSNINQDAKFFYHLYPRNFMPDFNAWRTWIQFVRYFTTQQLSIDGSLELNPGEWEELFIICKTLAEYGLYITCSATRPIGSEKMIGSISFCSSIYFLIVPDWPEEVTTLIRQSGMRTQWVAYILSRYESRDILSSLLTTGLADGENLLQIRPGCNITISTNSVQSTSNEIYAAFIGSLYDRDLDQNSGRDPDLVSDDFCEDQSSWQGVSIAPSRRLSFSIEATQNYFITIDNTKMMVRVGENEPQVYEFTKNQHDP